ncbi:hypothetical protein RN001_009365 [Aquatica leii]|uniref:Uncharacterized protein n=1 Tax=Aquatica leii TaxID=1421715 RepID=A0AAN7PTP0_9COLE|nr:hypothetical protein RN001_009365 [Aquatica leii]
MQDPVVIDYDIDVETLKPLEQQKQHRIRIEYETKTEEDEEAIQTELGSLIIYAKYYDCDPKSAGEIKKADQIVPYFIIEITASLRGLIGLFAAAIFGAAFSTVSTFLNTTAGIIYTDLAHFFIPKKLLREKPGIILKIFTVMIGLSSIGTLYLLEHVGTIFEVLYVVRGVTDGTVLGIFTLGLIFPIANTKGAVTGGIASLTLMLVLIIKSQMYLWSGAIKYETKPLYTYGCNESINADFNYTTLA